MRHGAPRHEVNIAIGYSHTLEERERVMKALKEEQQRTGLGFIQYKRILEILGYKEDTK